MIVREVGPDEKTQWNEFISGNIYGHVMQSWEWGDFKKSMGNHPIRLGVFDQNKLLAAASYTLHTVPYTQKNIGYLPKGPSCETPEALGLLLEGLKSSAEAKNCVFLKLEPNVPQQDEYWKDILAQKNLVKSNKEIFSRHTFYLDLTRSEEELLGAMHEKWRYNVRLSERKGVEVTEAEDDKSLDEFISLQKHTAKRNWFFVHPDRYYRNLFYTLKSANMAKLVIAKVEGQIVASWMLFIFGQTLYYPYGASSDLFREAMPSHGLMWAAIKLGKKLGCTRFDLWGAADPGAKPNDPWLGFTRFKAGFGPELVAFIGTYDLVLDDKWYKIINYAEKARWIWLKYFQKFIR